MAEGGRRETTREHGRKWKINAPVADEMLAAS